jgi:histidinol-phosphate aminotransferase
MSILDRVPEYVRSLVPYEPGKPIEEVEREYGIEDAIKIASNENPLGPSPKAVKAIAERLGGLHFYPDGDCYQLRRAVAAKLGVAEDRLIFGNGSNELIEFAVRTFMRPGDEAVMARHAFAIYNLVVKSAGGVSKIVPMKNLTHDLEAMGVSAASARRR